MRYTILIILSALFLSSCSKDKFQTVPSLKYESVNTNILSRGQTIVFTLSFTDAEGDLSDSLIVQKLVRVCPNGLDGSFIQPYKIPDFPSGKNQAGDIVVSYPYNDINPKCDQRNDTAIFRFVLKDKAQNKSDTAVSELIVVTF